jgi:hypothetical protein
MINIIIELKKMAMTGVSREVLKWDFPLPACKRTTV